MLICQMSKICFVIYSSYSWKEEYVESDYTVIIELIVLHINGHINYYSGFDLLLKGYLQWIF